MSQERNSTQIFSFSIETTKSEAIVTSMDMEAGRKRVYEQREID